MTLNCVTCKNTLWCKILSHISYISRDIANFVFKSANFRYHGNKGWYSINFCDTVKLHDPVKPALWSNNLVHIYYTDGDVANFVLKLTNFCYHSNKGWSAVNFNNAVKLNQFENVLFGARFSAIFLT